MYSSKTRFCAISFLIMLSACTVVQKELHHPGGYAGYKMDEYLFDARKSNQLQLLRYTLLATVVSSVAEGSLTDQDDKEIFVKRLKIVANQINYLAGDLNGVGSSKHCPANEPETDKCQSRPVMFQKNLPKLDYALGRMIISGLPQRQASEIAASISSANAISVGWKVIKLGAKIADGGHRGAASYRASIDTFMIAMNCANESAEVCLGTSDSRWLKIEKVEDMDKGKAIDAVSTLFDMMRQSCATVLSLDEAGVIASNSPGTECKEIVYQPKLRYEGLRIGAP